MRTLGLVLLSACVGAAVGTLVGWQVYGAEYSLAEVLFPPAEAGILEEVRRVVLDLPAIRSRILTAGGIGGLVAGAFSAGLAFRRG